MDSLSLTELAADLLAQARSAGSGRAARTVLGDSGHALRHTAMALLADRELAEHTSPGEASLLVLRGRVRLEAASGVAEGSSGALIPIPPERHTLLAIEDAAILLTVVVR